MGTNGGLEKRSAINGELESVYTKQSGLPNNDVECLILDGSEGIWAGLSCGGLAHLSSEGIWSVFDENNSDLPCNNVNALISDGAAGIWIGTGNPSRGVGLAHLSSEGIWSVFDENNSDLPGNNVNSLISDGAAGIWIGTGNFSGGVGLAHLSAEGTWSIFDESNSDLLDMGNGVISLLSDGSGGIWVGTGGGGLAHLSPEGIWTVFTRYSSDLPDNSILSLLADGSGGIWVGTGGGGLAHLSSEGIWSVFDKDNSDLPGNNVSSLISDGAGGIWGGTAFNGFFHLSSEEIWSVFDKYSFNSEVNQIGFLFPHPVDGILVARGGGLSRLSTEEIWSVFDQNNSELPINSVNCLLSDGAGGIWGGTSFNGFFHLSSEGNWSMFDEDNSELPVNDVETLLSDGLGGIWVGTRYGGLVHLNSEGIWSVFDEDHSELSENWGASENWVKSLLSDASGGIWVGTHGGGLIHLSSEGIWSVFDEDNSELPEDHVETLLSDGSGGIWVGTTFGGLAHLSAEGIWSVFDEDNSALPANSVETLLSDGSGGIWIGTYRGLAHLLLIGNPEQIPSPDSPDINITWFLNRSPFDFRKVHYIELQRSLSKNGVYETVYDASDNPVRFHADYSDCPNPWADDCWPVVEGHIPAVKGENDTQIKGYTLNTSIMDPEWLEGLPRYNRLAAVIKDNDGRLVTMAENRETTLMAPAVEENPRIGLSLDRTAIALFPGSEKQISLFLSSLDLFSGEVELAMEPDNINDFEITLNPASVSLTPGETKSLGLQIKVDQEVVDSEANIKIIAKTANQSTDKTVLLKVRAGTGPMAALSIARTRTRPRVMEGITVSGNIIPAQSEQEVIISGNNIAPLALTTDGDGNFEGSFIPTKAGTLALTAEYSGITSNTEEIFILPTKNHVALTSDVNQEISQGDNLRIQGRITPVRQYETKINLDIRYLDPSDPEAGLKPQFVGDVAIDENGVFAKDIVVPGNGFINVKASLSETPDFLGINTKLLVPVGQPAGEGIIVVSESGTPEFQDISKSLGTYVYNALQTRNIPEERIRYLGLSGDGIQVDGYADKNNLHHALTEWAVSLISTDDPYKTPLNFYLIGNVENGSFRLNDNEVLTSGELAQYLDEAESLIKNNSDSDIKGFPVTIVLEGSQSEEWIESISGEGRIILTSSSAKPLDQGGYAGYDNLGESSFSRYFYQFINYGSDIEGSFAEANYEILKFYRHIQRPVMDADGDGVGTTKYDRYEASGKFIEYRPSGNLRPEVRATNP
ncbi:MAG: two-component regulator propeller domain-containing protein, partial [Bacillota bacterium]|nr:two-component regulator propeller domain-containing protein [Bacillota bacterium]